MARQNEAIEQVILFNWARVEEIRTPELRLLFHVPNGGKRDAAEAAHLKRQGVKAGVPDIFLPVARGKYHGMFIELKAGKNPATTYQRQWIADLQEQGYVAEVCRGWQQAVNVITEYLRLGE